MACLLNVTAKPNAVDVTELKSQVTRSKRVTLVWQSILIDFILKDLCWKA